MSRKTEERREIMGLRAGAANLRRVAEDVTESGDRWWGDKLLEVAHAMEERAVLLAERSSS
jgi:hypothetical protein